jgi:hypothetical protein
LDKIFDLFKYGLITLFTAPFWIIYYIFWFIKGLVINIVLCFKAIIYFFQGKTIFTTKEDKIIAALDKKEIEDKEKRRQEVLNNVID